MGFGKKTEQNLAEQAEALPEGTSPLMHLVGKNSGKRPCKVLQIPGSDPNDTDAIIALVALRQSETQESRLASMEWLLTKKKMPEFMIESDMGQNLYNEEFLCQVLYRAMRVPDNLEKRFAMSANDVRMNLEPDQIVAIYQEFLVFQNERSPLKFLRTEKEMEDFISLMLKDQPIPTELSYYSTDTLRNILPALVKEHHKRMRQHSFLTSCPKCSFQFISQESQSQVSSEPEPLHDEDGTLFIEGGEGPTLEEVRESELKEDKK